ncbi:VPLPA-CTERM sorting domain-containing protein [Methylococcus sp. EFPC2]|uniref:VPLPA-CTERM sorting domain-containing protein n=1 Tax=Methylococcus sp. EFPC2 TaxID=2812648 RepID=UPI00196815D9|nr:VPLPA-CTERM sorting domain-containing protein [Methylococcus sp. EFPC2]QSA97029.1 VPLPA-CTERM sorting domain-containing protein [Methylococcus sp. EFPC2]
MNSKLQLTVRFLLAGAALAALSSGAHAAGAVTAPSAALWTGSDNILGANETITSTSIGLADTSGGRAGWTGNALLNYSAWGHAVKWLSFQVTGANQTVTISDAVTSGARDLAFTVWASNGAFDGGTGVGEESLSTQSPHSSNVVSQLGANGTKWASDPSVVAGGGGNLLETLAYVNAGGSYGSGETDWGETVNSGVNQVGGNTYFSGVSGSASAALVQLTFQNLAPGWYTVAAGGANNAITGLASHQLSVSAVPIPAAVYLLGSALAGLGIVGRRRQDKTA